MPHTTPSRPHVLIAVDLVILTLRDNRLHLLLIERGTDPLRGVLALPGGFLDHEGEDIERAARRELAEETRVNAAGLHLEQLRAYGAPGRDPRGRVISIAYLAIAPGLPEPVSGGDAAGATWLPVDTLNNQQLAFDHQQIVADGIERARTRLEYTTLATAFCAPTFTLAELQRVYEAVWCVRLDPRNFYRKVRASVGFVESAGPARRATAGRPARLYRAGARTRLQPPILRPAQARTEEDQW